MVLNDVTYAERENAGKAIIEACTHMNGAETGRLETVFATTFRVSALSRPHTAKNRSSLESVTPRIAGEKQQHIELDPGQRQRGSVLKRLLGSSVNGQLREGKRVPGAEGDPLCGDVLPPQKGQDLFLQIPLRPVCLNDDHSVSVCYSASSSWSKLTISIALTAQS